MFHCEEWSLFLIEYLHIDPFWTPIDPASGDVGFPIAEFSISVCQTNIFITNYKVNSVVFRWFRKENE